MKYHSRITFFIAFFVFCLLAVSASSAVAQYKGKAVKKDKLLNVLRSRQLQSREIVAVIKANGVDFRVDETAEAELTGAGARPEVIEAAKANYRGDTAVAATKPPAPATSSGSASTAVAVRFAGKPLDKAQILSLLDAGMAEAQIVKNIQARGVSYYQSPRDKQDVRNAGGSPALVNLIEGSYAGADSSSAGTQTSAGTSSGTTGKEEGDEGFGDFNTNNSPEALQRSIANGTAPATVYQQLGIVSLYQNRNLVDAETAYREAINRGGSGVFKVAHDHGSGLFTDGCLGTLFIAKDTVRFESDNNIHTFETPITTIEKAKMNGGFASLFKNIQGSFSIKLRTGEKDSKNYNFAPVSSDPNESKMLLRLIGKN